jgi:pSer/pThr/pTyr-binding forkhead associated (FHA) protein
MATHPSNKDGGDGDSGYQPDAGLDAKLDRAVPSGDADAFLVGVGQVHGGRVYPLEHNTVSIGRADDADVRVVDPSVSARHARIINGSAGFELEDLESTNGTMLEGKRIVRAHLRSGDRITLGQVEFKFLVDRRVDATMTILPSALPASPVQGGSLIRYQPPPQRSETRRPPPAHAKSEDDEEGLSLAEIINRLVVIYRFIYENHVLIGLLAASGALLGLASILLIPSPREASCVVKLLPGVKTNPVDTQWNRNPGGEEGEVRFFAGAETVFGQAELVATTLKKLEGRAPTESEIAAVSGGLRLEPLPDRGGGSPYNAYRASYREKTFGTSATVPEPTALLTAHLENYLHGEINHALRVFTAQADFLRSQLGSVEEEMKKISDQKMKFSQQNADRLPQEADQMLGSRFDLESRRSELVAQVRRLQGELEAQRHAVAAEGPLSSSKRTSTDVYRQSLAGINSKLTAAYARGLADGHPEVRQLKDEKERIEALIAQEMTSETNAVDRRSNAGYQELQNKVVLLQAQLSAARSDLADTDATLGRVRNVVGDLPRVQAGVQQLTHMQEATTALHGQLFEQLKKAELQLNLERVSAESRYEVVAPPQIVKPGRLKIVAVRVIIGAFVGLFIAAIVLMIRVIKRLVLESLARLDGSRSSTRS